MDSIGAKQFLISKVIEEAAVEHVPLSDIEKKMLQFTEVHPTLPDIHEVNEEFEREYDSDEYERKIATLLKNARAREESNEQQWKDALDALRHEDHYILVMIDQAFGASTNRSHTVRDFLLYIGIGVLVVLAILWRAG